MTRIEEIESRLSKATPGPWIVHDMGSVDQPKNHVQPDRPWWWVWQEDKLPYYGGVVKVEDYGEGKNGAIGEATAMHGDREISQQYADAEFIAHSPADVAYLLAELRKAQDKLGRVEGVAAEWQRMAQGGRSQFDTALRACVYKIRAAVADATGGGE